MTDLLDKRLRQLLLSLYDINDCALVSNIITVNRSHQRPQTMIHNETFNIHEETAVQTAQFYPTVLACFLRKAYATIPLYDGGCILLDTFHTGSLRLFEHPLSFLRKSSVKLFRCFTAIETLNYCGCVAPEFLDVDGPSSFSFFDCQLSTSWRLNFCCHAIISESA